MLKLTKLVCTLFLVFCGLQFSLQKKATAGILLDLDSAYISNKLATGTTIKVDQTNYNFGIYYSIDKTFWAGWSYLAVDQKSSGSTPDYTFKSTDMGPTFKWQFGKGRAYSFTLTYNVSVTATYNDTTNEKLSGSSLLAKLSFMPEIKEGTHIGVSLQYYQPTYPKKIVSSTESTANYKATQIYPSLGFITYWQ